MASDLYNRIHAYCQMTGTSVTAFENAVGIGRGTLVRMTHGIRSDKLADALRAFPDLSPDYLLGLSDTMFRAESERKSLEPTTQVAGKGTGHGTEMPPSHGKIDGEEWYRRQIDQKDAIIRWLMKTLEDGR